MRTLRSEFHTWTQVRLRKHKFPNAVFLIFTRSLFFSKGSLLKAKKRLTFSGPKKKVVGNSLILLDLCVEVCPHNYNYLFVYYQQTAKRFGQSQKSEQYDFEIVAESEIYVEKWFLWNLN